MGPIIIQDLPAEHAALGFDDYAKTLARIIQESKPRIAIGIFGGWGSGKTTLMNAIQRSLTSPAIVKAEFSAWRYEKEPNLIVPLLDVVRDAVVKWSKEQGQENEATGKVVKTVGRAIRALLAGFAFKAGIANVLEVTVEADKVAEAWGAQGKAKPEDEEATRSVYHACFTALGEAFAAFAGDDPDRRIVVFVDDLDRCLPVGAMEVLEAIKLFFDLPGFVFVVGLDQKVIEAAVEIRYREFNESREHEQAKIKGAEYIKKIFQVPFALSPVYPGELETLLKSYMDEAGVAQAQRDNILDVVQPHLHYVVAGNPINPRDIKRFINNYTITSSLRPKLKENVILALQAMSTNGDWADLYESLLSFRHMFILALQRYLSNDNEALENLDDRLVNLPPEFIEYVQGPAAELRLVADSIENYIYAGVTTRPEGDPALVDAIFDLTRIRGRMSDLPARLTTDNEAALASISTELSHLSSRLLSRSASSASSGYVHREITGIAGEVQTRVDTLRAFKTKPGSNDTGFVEVDWAPLIARMKALVRRLTAGQSGRQEYPDGPAAT